MGTGEMGAGDAPGGVQQGRDDATRIGPGFWTLMLGVFVAALTVPDDWPLAGELVVSLLVTVIVAEGAGAVGRFIQARRQRARQHPDH